jgi:predicted transcriptional regulator
MNVSIYFDDDLLKKLDHETKRQGASRSELVQKAVHEYLSDRRRALPAGFREVLGSWEDERRPQDILAEIGNRSVKG